MFIYHIFFIEQKNANSTLFEKREYVIMQQAVPEPGCIQTKSSLSIDVNCQNRLTSCHSVSDYQHDLITATAHKLGDAASALQK